MDPGNIIKKTVKLHGGHVGVEYEPGKVLSFQPLKYTGIAASGHLLSNFRNANFNSRFRIASATYDVLQAAGIVPPYRHQLWYNVFTTREFRFLLYREYLRNKDKGWQLYTCKGSVSRKWEKDVDNWSR